MKKICLVLGIVLLLLSAYSVNAIGNKLYFTIQDNKIVYENNNEEDVFMQHLDMLPGSNYVDELEIENGTKTNYTLYLKVEEISQSKEAIELLNSIDMVLYLDNVPIYSGKAKGLDYLENGINLQNAIKLKEFKSGEKSLLKVETKLSEEYSSKNNNELSKINWVFYAQYENNEPEIIEEVPKTDKNNDLMVIISLIIFLIGVFVIIYTQNGKKKIIN